MPTHLSYKYIIYVHVADKENHCGRRNLICGQVSWLTLSGGGGLVHDNCHMTEVHVATFTVKSYCCKSFRYLSCLIQVY